jgi:hypothetical protein
MIATTIGLVLGAMGAVQAAEVFTPPVFVTDNENFACAIVNAGPRALMVQILIKNASGGTTGDSGELSLAAGAVASWVNLDVNQFRYCHFIVEGGGKRSEYRAVGCIFVDSGSSKDCVAAE